MSLWTRALRVLQVPLPLIIHTLLLSSTILQKDARLLLPIPRMTVSSRFVLLYIFSPPPFFFWSNVLSGPKLPCLISFSPYEVIPSIYYGLYLEHLHPSHSPWYTCCQSPSPIHTWSSSKLYLKQYFSMKPLSPVSRVLYHTWIHWLQIKLVKDKLLHLSKLIFSAAF